MRVISGTARSIPLKAPAGMDTRPTTDKIKETLFNMLQFEIQDSLFIDIFAGSGAIGIEALSRGAGRAVFADNSRKACGVIEYNVRKCHFEDRALICRTEASLVKNYMPGSPDRKLVIFMDPPYGRDLEFAVLKGIIGMDIIRDDTLIVVEEAIGFDSLRLEALSLAVKRVKEYKNQKHIFLRKA